MNNDALIVFAYNRPEHIKITLESIFKYKPDNLKTFIFVDGPKRSTDTELVRKTIDMIYSFSDRDEFKFIDIITRKANLGLASSVIDGVNYVLSDKEIERFIVLEDDCVPDKNFFEYMKDSFDFYEKENNLLNNKIMHISGYGLPLEFFKKHSYNYINYLNSYPSSWGWGTWRKYWVECNFNDNKFYDEILNNDNLRKEFDKDGSAFSEFLNLQLNGNINSWLIRWYVHLFKKEALCSWKVISSVNNEGFDGTGNHRVKIDRYNQSEDYKEKLRINENEYSHFQKQYYDINIKSEFSKYFVNKKDKFKMKNLIYYIKKRLWS